MTVSDNLMLVVVVGVAFLLGTICPTGYAHVTTDDAQSSFTISEELWALHFFDATLSDPPAGQQQDARAPSGMTRQRALLTASGTPAGVYTPPVYSASPRSSPRPSPRRSPCIDLPRHSPPPRSSPRPSQHPSPRPSPRHSPLPPPCRFTNTRNHNTYLIRVTSLTNWGYVRDTLHARLLAVYHKYGVWDVKPIITGPAGQHRRYPFTVWRLKVVVPAKKCAKYKESLRNALRNEIKHFRKLPAILGTTLIYFV